MKSWGLKALSALALCIMSSLVFAQSNADVGCKLVSPTFVTAAHNIFNDRQEQDLGDAMAEYVESDLRIAVPAADDQLTRIGERLLATLPPTGLKYRFRIYDSGEVNGFSLPGGRVYISRKLIAAVKSEDELAGVLAHEIGHIVTHQSTIEMTRILRIRLGVTQLTDRADVFSKVHKLLSTPEKSNEGEDSEEKNQLAADQVALYAMVQAGYDANSFAGFMNESMSNKGKTGNWITDAFGLTHEAAQRYRRALKLAEELPSDCKGRKPVVSQTFSAWQRANVEDRVKFVATGATGDKELKLDPPLRQSLWRISFSPDGRYVLTQDAGSVTVLDRTAGNLKVLFAIDAPDAGKAQFTPDSAGVVFHDENLRVERWDIATGKRLSVKEVVIYEGCTQTALSPDGKTLACVKADFDGSIMRIGLKLVDVESGAAFYDKPSFREIGFMNAGYYLMERVAADIMLGKDIVVLQFSPDAHYLLAGDTARVLAWDLQTRRPVVLGGKLHSLEQTMMSFVGPNQLFLMGSLKSNNLRHGLLYSFPEGNLIKDIDIGEVNIRGAAKGNTLIISPLKEYAAGILDIDSEKIVGATKISTIDVFDKWVASESPGGGLQVGMLGSAQATQIPLPLSPLPGIRAATISNDGRYMAFSMSNRGAIWNVETGEQIMLMRPFRGAWLDENDRLWAQFPKYENNEEQEATLTLEPRVGKNLGKFEPEDRQYQNLQLRLKPMGKDKSVQQHATLEAKMMETQKVAWSHDFQHETPAFWPAEDDRLVLGWDLSNESAKLEIKNNPQLQKQAETLKDKKKGLLLETVVPETGVALQQVIIPETDLSGGWHDVRRAMVSGDFVLVRGEHANTVIYRIDGSGKVGEFFGIPVATDAKTGIVAGVNRDNEVLLVDERTGKEMRRFTLASPVRLASIVGNKDKTLLLLTADQVVHRVPLAN